MSVHFPDEPFLPRHRAMGLAVDEELSPALLKRLTYPGTQVPSLRTAYQPLDVLLRTQIGLKRTEPIIEWIGRERISKLAREFTSVAASQELATARTDGRTSLPGVAADPAATVLTPATEPRSGGDSPPQVLDRDVVATRRDSRPFGKHLAARAWWLGGFGAVREGFVGDGQKAQRQAGYFRVVRIRPSMTADSGSILDATSGIDFPA